MGVCDLSAQLSRPWVRRSCTALLCFVVGVSLGIGWYQTNLQPGAEIVKHAFEAQPAVIPPANFSDLAKTVNGPDRVAVEAKGLPPAAIDIYRPINDEGFYQTRPIVLWIHGGGFISNSSAMVADYLTMLAANGYVVAGLDYSLAPGARHPVPVQQAIAALEDLIEHADTLAGDPERVFIAGDSAGAQIASEVASVLSNSTQAERGSISSSVPPSAVRGVILFCGLYDMQTVAATNFPALRTFMWAYTGHRDWSKYPQIDQLSTARTAAPGYPATFLSVGDADPFASQATEFASSLTKVGVDVSTLFWDDKKPGLGHEYQFDFREPEAHDAFNAVLEFLDERSR